MQKQLRLTPEQYDMYKAEFKALEEPVNKGTAAFRQWLHWTYDIPYRMTANPRMKGNPHP
eukprot:3639313-Rhodomonas_salina.1